MLVVNGDPNSVDGRLLAILSTGVDPKQPRKALVQELYLHHEAVMKRHFADSIQCSDFLKNHRQRFAQLARYERG